MDLKDIRKIMDLMKSHELSEFEISEEPFRMSIKRGSAPLPQPVVAHPAQVAAPAAAPVAAAPAAASAEDAVSAEEAGWVDIVSPIVGTFYRSATPEADPFVSVGQEVDEETVVCIVEAMKVMNEIKADVKGVVRKVTLDNSSPVEYGQVVFKVEPR